MSRLRKTCLFSVVLLLLIVGMVPAAGAAKPTGMLCESLVNLTLEDTVISSATVVPAGGQLPGDGNPVAPLPTCRVVGAISGNINFEVWLPVTDWNGKFNGVGNGGLAGFINYSSMLASLARGYAAASTDTGHQGFLGDGSWALNRPDLLIDFGYRAIHVTTVAAKAIVQAYYGKAPRYSYFTGCSGGGQQGLQETQMYPKDYDGVVSGAPANFPTHMWPGELWPAWVAYTMGTQLSLGGPPGPPVPTPKLLTLNAAAVAACDGADGVVDGVIDDPRKCNFNPQSLLCQGPDGPNCLTQAEIDTVKAIYGGLKDPTTGKQFWPGYEKGSEDQWAGHINPFSIPPSYFKYMVYKDPAWDYHTYDMTSAKNFADIYKADRELGPILNATDANLTPFWAHGGKLLMYHGWSDQNIAPRNSISYLKTVMDKMGDSKRKVPEFLRLFMVPGMGHCGGGPGTDTFDSLGALEQWVENGIAPTKIIASNLGSGRTRPLCPYPQVARWTGVGDTNKAENFVCVNP